MARHLCLLMHSARRKVGEKSLQAQNFEENTGNRGLGRIGIEVARRRPAFDMEIVAHDPFVSVGVAKEQESACLPHELYAAPLHHFARGPHAANHGHDQRQSIKKMKKGVRW